MDALFQTVHALKEAVEQQQGVRTRSITQRSQSELGRLRSRGTTAWPSDASLDDLNGIVEALAVDTAANTAAIAALDARLVTAEATLVDHEARIVALEP